MLVKYLFKEIVRVYKQDKLKNAKDEEVTVPGDWRMMQESHPHTKAAAETPLWKIKVPAKGETVLTYRVEVKY